MSDRMSSAGKTGIDCRVVLIVAAIFVRSAFQMGVIKSIGVFLPGIQASFVESATGIGVALGLYTACNFCPAPLVAYFYSRLPSPWPRVMLIGGPVLSSLGFALASLTANYAQFTACMGLTGFGFSFMLMCLLLELSEQAGTHFGICLGIGMAGFAVGMAIIPLLGEFLMTIYGWRGAMLILGGLMGNITPMTAAILPKVPTSSQSNVERKERGTKEKNKLMRSDASDHKARENRVIPTTDDEQYYTENEELGSLIATPVRTECTTYKAEGPHDRGDYSARQRRENLDLRNSSLNRLDKDQSQSNSFSHTAKWTRASSAIQNSLNNSEYYQNPSLTLYLTALVPYGMSYGAWHSFLIPRAAESGLAISHVILVSVCVAVANITGRIVVGLAAEKFRRPHEIHLTLTFMNATFVLCDVLIFRSAAIFRTTAIFVTSFLCSFAMAGRGVLVAMLSRCLASADHRFIAMGIGEFNVGLGSLAGAFIAGFMADRFGGFNLSFAMVVGFEIPVFLLVLLSRLKKETR